jgi:KDO2-lipid IV(A) lauroyltransferase
VSFLSNIVDRTISSLLQYVLKYRKTVIRHNLESSFTYTDQQELMKDTKKNYHFLAKLFRQILVKPSGQLLESRMHLQPCPQLDQWLSENKSVLITFGHIGNWEWAGSFIGLSYPGKVCALYKKIKSGYVNDLMKRRRLTHVNYLVEIGQISELLKLMKQKPVLVLMIADQNPGSDQGIIWANFFGKETAFVNGPESLALRYALPVVYLNIHPLAKGQYDLQFDILFDGLEPVKQGEITQRFAQRLEANIRRHRTEWLWSHRRWKRQRKPRPANS